MRGRCISFNLEKVLEPTNRHSNIYKNYQFMIPSYIRTSWIGSYIYGVLSAKFQPGGFQSTCSFMRVFTVLEVLLTMPLVAVNLSLFAFTSKRFVPSKRKCISLIWYKTWPTKNYRKTLNLTCAVVFECDVFVPAAVVVRFLNSLYIVPDMHVRCTEGLGNASISKYLL